jgi:outer membrane protein assembly factor BamB
MDGSDHFICLEPLTGTVLWELEYAAIHELDYGNSPRATPTIHDPFVFLLGASGHLHCVDIDSGKIRWKKELVADLHGERPEWGYASSPIVVGNQLIVQPGGKLQSIAALDLETGATRWTSKADQTAYASPQPLSKRRSSEVLLVDRSTYLAIDGQSGKTLWRIPSSGASEFRVPMPLVLSTAIITSGEIHGTRRFETDASGVVSVEPSAEQLDLSPDTQSLVANDHWIFGVQNELLALDAKTLEIAWRLEDPTFSHHCSLIISNERLLAVNEDSEAILIDATAKPVSDPKSRIIGRQVLGDHQTNSLAHPAIVGDTLYVRTGNAISAWLLSN